MADLGVLTNTFESFREVFINGINFAVPLINNLLRTLLKLEVIFIGIFIACGKTNNVEDCLKRLIVTGFIIAVITNFIPTIEFLMNLAKDWGLIITSTGNGVNLNFVNDPSLIAQIGYDLTFDIFKSIGNSSWRQLGKMITLAITGYLILFAYFLLAIQVTLALIEFYLMASLSLILIPFGVFKQTSFLAEGVISTLLGAFIKLATLITIVGFGITLVDKTGMIPDSNLSAYFGQILTAILLLILSWTAPGIAVGMITGRPSFDTGSAGGAVMGAGRAMSAVSRGGSNVAGALKGTAGATKNTVKYGTKAASYGVSSAKAGYKGVKDRFSGSKSSATSSVNKSQIANNYNRRRPPPKK